MPDFLPLVVRVFPLAVVIGLLAGCDQAEAPDDATDHPRQPEVARMMPAKDALAGAHIPTLDPATMVEAEIRAAIGAGPRCEFRYTSAGKPILAVSEAPDGSAAAGIVKLNGKMVALTLASTERIGDRAESIQLVAEPVRMTVTPDRGARAEAHLGAQRRVANVVFEVGQELKVGYRGYWDCVSEPPVKLPRA